MDVLRAGQQWLSEQLTQFVSREVTYKRDEHAVVLQATLGKTHGEQDVGDGLVLRLEIRDYLINVEALILNGQRTLPERGDQILELQDGFLFTYEVLPIGNQKPWRYSDPYRLILRVHTKLINTEEV